MNAPMREGIKKTIFARSSGLKVSDRVKKLLIGAEVVWFDKVPLSQDMDDALHFFFDSHTSSMTDALLRKQGLTDVSQYINIPMQWEVTMELVYAMPNRSTEDSVKTHSEFLKYRFHGTIFPMSEKFKSHRDKFYLLKNMEFAEAPDDHKNKKMYETTKFTCVVVGL